MPLFISLFSLLAPNRCRFGGDSTFEVGITSIGQLRDHAPGDDWHHRRFFRGGRHYVYSHVGDLNSLESRALAQVNRLVRGCPGRHLHNDRGANFRHEHESRADFCIGGSSSSLARSMALLHRPSHRHVIRRRTLCADPRCPKHRLRQTPSRKY